MKHRDVQNDLNEDFEAGTIQAGPDGTLRLQQKAPRPSPPRLCEVGPCRQYHTFTIQMDVETPKGSEVRPGGKIEGGEQQPFYVERHHYCYPTIGVEMTLGSLPIMSCNRWTPRYLGVDGDAKERDAFQGSAEWKEYQFKLDAWKASHAPARVELEFVMVKCGALNVSFTASSATTVGDLHARALAMFRLEFPGHVVLTDDVGDPYTNMSATLGALGTKNAAIFKLVHPGG